MKAELELGLDKDGRPCIKIKHFEKDQSLEQKVLGIFIEAATTDGIHLRPIEADKYEIVIGRF